MLESLLEVVLLRINGRNISAIDCGNQMSSNIFLSIIILAYFVVIIKIFQQMSISHLLPISSPNYPTWDIH